jgi:HD-like signal output (HDOD) protein
MARTDDSPASFSIAEDSPVRARLTRILEDAEFPALSKQIIETISALDDDAASLQRLANVVLREYSLTLSVVRTANSVHYRRSGRPIQSATHAMMMLGARTVRAIASSLLLFENYTRRSPELKELMLLSLLTANHAWAVATKLELAEPEEAHLCGMFRNLGEVLIACHFPEDYARIQGLMRDDGRSESAATKIVLGFPFADLGAEVSKLWGMPDSVIQGIRARASSSASVVASVTVFSHELTMALYGEVDDLDDIPALVDDVLERHRGHIKLARDQVGRVVTDALQETRELFSSPHIATDRLRMRQLAQSARAALGVDVEVDAEVDGASTQDGVSTARRPGSHQVSLRTRLRQEVEEKADALDTPVGEVLLLALEAILRGGPFDRVLFCVLNGDRTELAARTGLGEGVEAFMTQMVFPMSVRGGPVVALTQLRMAVYLPVDRSFTTVEQRWALSMGITQFGVFPVIVAGKIVGCLYCDRVGSEATLPDRATVRYVKAVTSLVVESITRRRHG